MSNTLRTAHHAGDCCGISSVYEFPVLSSEYSDKDRMEMIQLAIEKAVRLNYNKFNLLGGSGLENRRHCIEVVLIAAQVTAWEDALIACGFVEVFEFFNSNSKNTCHVFMMETGKG